MFRDLGHAARMGEKGTRSTVRSFLWWTTNFIAWGAVLLLVVIAALRVFYFDGNIFLTWLNAFTRYLYLPAYVCFAWAWWQHRRLLMLASAIVVVGHLILMMPDFVRDRRFDPASASVANSTDMSPPVRVFFANVLLSNQEHAALFQEIDDANPDAIVVAEWSRRWHMAFMKSDLAAAYPYGVSISQPMHGHTHLFSKRPIKNEMQNWVSDRLVRTADIDCGSYTLRVIGIHAPRPEYDETYEYGEFWSQMVPLLQSEPGPLLLIGDFNSTEHSRVYQELKAIGLRSAHDDRGRGYASTWPNGSLPLPPIRIDQAFVSAGVECEGVWEGEGKGSDHKPVIVDLRVRSDTK